MKNSIEAYGAEGKTNLLRFDPDKLKLVTDKNHPLYDPRVHDPVDKALVASIKMKGVIEPIIVWKDPESGETCVVDGRGRTKAAQEANRQLKEAGEVPKEIFAVIGKGNAQSVMGTMVLANEGRREPTVTGRANMARRLIDAGYSEEQTAVLLHCSKATIGNYLLLLGATAVVRDAADTGKVSPTICYGLAKLEPTEQREKLATMLAAAEGETGKRKRSKKMKAATGQSGRPSVNDLKAFHTDLCDVSTDPDYRAALLGVVEWMLGKGKRPRITKAAKADKAA